MTDQTPAEQIDSGYGEDEDTNPTSLASKVPVLGWYLRATKSFGRSRSFFMPLGFMGLCGLAIFLGFSKLEELTNLVLIFLHKSAAMLSFMSDDALDTMNLAARRTAVPFLASLWAVAITLRLSLGAFRPARDKDDIGYVVPGSGFIGRTWAIFGRKIYQLKQAVTFFASYIRDLNLEKLYLPLAIPLLLLLAIPSTALAFENLFYELPAHFPSMADQVGWIHMTSWIMAIVTGLILGIPLLANSLLRAHHKSIERRKRKTKLLRRWLSGLFGVIFVLAPIAWMALSFIAGNLY
ncbi:MAG: hypothetical protein JRJ87_24330 [Deltaproteobacteria bacterium]|nr:hypothetical protein [Deltaproteobacteria bacterium]